MLVAQLCLTVCNPMDLACQAPLPMGVPRQEYWSGLPFPSPEDFPDPGIEPMSSAFPALAGGFFTPEPSGKPCAPSNSIVFVAQWYPTLCDPRGL